jgi:WD40 repeat protein
VRKSNTGALAVQVLKGHGKKVHSLAFSPDGSLLAAFGQDRVVRLWDASGELRAKLPLRSKYGLDAFVAFSPDGRLVAATDGGVVHIWEVATGNDFKLLPEDALDPGLSAWATVHGIAFAPGFDRLVACRTVAGAGGGYRNDTRWWDTRSWQEVPSSPFQGPEGYCDALTFSPDGRLVGAVNGQGLWIWYMAGQTRMFDRRLQLATTTTVLAFSPDSRYVAFGGGTELTVADLVRWAAIATLRLAKKYFQSAAFTPDGRYLATVSNEETVKIWDTATWELRTELAWQIGGLKCVAFAPDGMRAACGGDRGRVVVWDVDL